MFASSFPHLELQDVPEPEGMSDLQNRVMRKTWKEPQDLQVVMDLSHSLISWKLL
jgi:hypothetical protein